MAPPVAPPTPTRRRRVCNTLWMVDTDRDGKVGSLDRYWRYFEHADWLEPREVDEDHRKGTSD